MPTNSWQGLRDTAIFTLLYGCGLRISEALSLNVGDVNDNDFLRIKGKGNKERIVPLLPIVAENIKNMSQNALINSGTENPYSWALAATGLCQELSSGNCKNPGISGTLPII